MKNNYKNLYIYKLLASIVHRWTVGINPEYEIKRVYCKTFHKYPNLQEPKNLIEKIYWLQLNSDTSLWTKCADKYAMRDYVKDCGYGDYLPKNLGKWDNVGDIDFSLLPNTFVLKPNNGSGTVLLVRDKSSLNEKAIKKQLQHWLNVPYGWAGAQLHYTRIKPCIIAEEFLKQDADQFSISPESLVDYKVWCINGKPESVLVVYGRSRNGYSLDLYDTQWNRLDFYLKKDGHFRFNQKSINKPNALDSMLEMASVLANPFPEVRVDFFIVGGKPIIGELTFTTGYGYFTDEYYDYLGNKLIVNL